MDGGRKEEDGWMDECMKKGGQMSAAGGNCELMYLFYWLRNGKITIQGKWKQLWNRSTTKISLRNK